MKWKNEISAFKKIKKKINKINIKIKIKSTELKRWIKAMMLGDLCFNSALFQDWFKHSLGWMALNRLCSIYVICLATSSGSISDKFVIVFGTMGGGIFWLKSSNLWDCLFLLLYFIYKN